MGYWQAYNVTLIDQAGNLRNQKNNDFGWRMYVNNPLEDLIAPAYVCLLYTSPSPRDATLSRMPSSA